MVKVHDSKALLISQDMRYFWIVLLLLRSSFSSPADSRTAKYQHSTPTAIKNRGELSKQKCLEYYPASDIPATIAGGNVTQPKEFPHMAALGYEFKSKTNWQCGGSLVSKKFVLTAAHCTTDPVPKYVRLGDLDLSTDDDDAQPQNFTIVNIIPHPSYNPPVIYHDIAFLELDRDAVFNEYVSPACLHTEKEVNETELVATGWGDTEFGGAASNVLLKVELDHVPHAECVKKFGKYPRKILPHGIDEEDQLCAGKVRGKDTCQGDSGGPLQVKSKERSSVINVHNVFGLTSYGKACALAGTPALYTRVSSYISWIESIAWQYETIK